MNKKFRNVTAPDWDMAKYRQLEEGEIIQPGDQVDASNDGWRDEPRWEPTTCIGQPAPNPLYPSHRRYRRPTPAPADGERYACPKCGERLEKGGWCEQHGLFAVPRR